MPDKQRIHLQGNGEKKYEIPAEGSLGLLALGARGIIEWRKVRNAKRNGSDKGS